MDADAQRLERVADIEGTSRAVNEEIRRAAPNWPHPGGPSSFRCECADDGCEQPLFIPREVYERVREDPLLFVVTPGHRVPGAEEVVERGEGFWIVRKPEAVPHPLEDGGGARRG